MDKKDKWERLISMPEEYESDSSIADRVLEEFAQQSAQKKEGWFAKHWKKLVACVVPVLLVVGIGVPVYTALTKPQPSQPPVVYYDNDDVVYSDVTDIATFVEEKNLSVGFFDLSTARTQCGVIEETNEVACLFQEVLCVSEIGFDTIQLNIIFKKNLELDFFKSYIDFTHDTVVDGVSVSYKYSDNGSGERQILAKFTYQKADYYLDIVTVTESDTVACINTYVGMLIK